jgi:hypothetical protein
VALGITGGLTHMRCGEVLEVAAISLFVGCLFLYGGCSTCDDALGECRWYCRIRGGYLGRRFIDAMMRVFSSCSYMGVVVTGSSIGRI